MEALSGYSPVNGTWDELDCPHKEERLLLCSEYNRRVASLICVSGHKSFFCHASRQEMNKKLSFKRNCPGFSMKSGLSSFARNAWESPGGMNVRENHTRG